MVLTTYDHDNLPLSETAHGATSMSLPWQMLQFLKFTFLKSHECSMNLPTCQPLGPYAMLIGSDTAHECTLRHIQALVGLQLKSRLPSHRKKI